MSKKVLFVLVFVLMGLFVLAGCAPQEVEVTRVVTETEEVEVTRVVTETVEVEGEMVEVTRVVEVEKRSTGRRYQGKSRPSYLHRVSLPRHASRSSSSMR